MAVIPGLHNCICLSLQITSHSFFVLMLPKQNKYIFNLYFKVLSACRVKALIIGYPLSTFSLNKCICFEVKFNEETVGISLT